MSAGKMASMSIPATTKTTVYTVPDCAYAELSLNLVNTSGSTVTTKVYISKSDTPTNVDLVAFDQVVPANGGLLLIQDKLSPGEKYVVEASATGLVARVSGVLFTKAP